MSKIEYKGERSVTILYEYYTNTGIPTGNTKPNNPSDPDYIPVEPNSADCEVIYKYLNDEVTVLIPKNDCETGVGSLVSYTVPEGKYIADTQQEADDLALLDIQILGQEYANENGTCI